MSTLRNSRKNRLLELLATIFDEYNLSIGYTIDDDGIHLSMEEDIEIFIGFLDSASDSARALREAKDYD